MHRALSSFGVQHAAIQFQGLAVTKLVMAVAVRLDQQKIADFSTATGRATRIEPISPPALICPEWEPDR